MDEYIAKFDSFNKVIIYDFSIGDGGIGDCIKFFMFILNLCIKSDTRLYYKRNNVPIEKYIKLCYDCMFIDADAIKHIDCKDIKIVSPYMYYSLYNLDTNIPIQNVFMFSKEVYVNLKRFLPDYIKNYSCIHIRLGDKFLETDKQYIQCISDDRKISNREIYKCIEDNSDNNIYVCSDNNAYKCHLKNKYDNIIIANCSIGHTSLSNTTEIQTLDSVTEFYILAHSDIIYASSVSGFSIIASKYNNIPYKLISI